MPFFLVRGTVVEVSKKDAAKLKAKPKKKSVSEKWVDRAISKVYGKPKPRKKKEPTGVAIAKQSKSKKKKPPSDTEIRDTAMTKAYASIGEKPPQEEKKS